MENPLNQPTNPKSRKAENRENFTTAIERGINYVESKRKEGIYPEDFGLRHGNSTAWSTAYVGRLLHEVKPTKAIESRTVVANMQNDDGGWSYNESVPSDADSTANALLFLRDHLDPEKYKRAIEFIKLHQHDNGGVSTYTIGRLQGMGYKGEGWAMPHVCVTALVAEVLEGPEKERAVQFLRNQTRPDGSFPAYWWSSDLYATNESMKVLGVEPKIREYFKSVKCDNVFDLSIKIQALVSMGENTETLVEDLLKMQQPDGGWPSSPILKIPRPEVRPGKIVENIEITMDKNRLFSTINALLALKLSINASLAK